ncbi:DNA translocase FtsK 4TM domain-containing protein [Sulfurimonas sp. HSL1-2]|uniref:FtsK/SpoIIIE family DNA translocase n=1 Tax=Thiomicrolovo zhangzhouensis TaxID=3131933 RepID=UPI0031F809B1
MRQAFFITVLAILVYAGISTIIADAAVIGTIGEIIAKANRALFGYVAFAYLFALLYPLYRYYRNSEIDVERTEKVLAGILLFFSLLILQALVTEGPLRGALGAGFVDFLEPYIGTFGLWVFWLMTVTIAAVILIDAEKFPSMPKPKLPFSFRKAEEEDDDEEPEYSSYTPAAGKRTVAAEQPGLFDDDPFDTPAYERMKMPLDSEEAPIRLVSKGPKEALPDEGDDEEDLPVSTPAAKAGTILAMAEGVRQKKSAVIVEELDENKKLLEQIEKGKSEKPKNFKLPSLDFFQKPPKQGNSIDERELDDKIRDLIEKLAQFKIDGDVIRTYAGPVVSTFEFKPAAHIKVSKIMNLQDDLAMALRAETIRIQAPIPGKDVVGIEIPNHTVETIYLREIFESKLFQEAKSPLTIALGKDIVGKPFITDLKKLPHLLIAGTTGSGKSVGINAMILSLLYKNSPDQLRLLMIDPKMLEFSIYNDIPHLLTPVITKAKQAIAALNNMVGEMERRYQLMSESRTKNIENYNEKMKREGGQPFPYIVVIIDELADLMMTSGKDVEYSIARLAQMARASGIHLIVATQRPSVDVVTGLIKANLPSRISYRVGQRVDSKIILDAQGAESLLGRGDMLFTPPGATGLIRLHAPWSTEEEIDHIVEFLKSQREPQYDDSFLAESGSNGSSGSDEGSIEDMDELYEEAKEIVLADRKTSISYLQRKLQIGYNRAARIIEQMEQRGLLSPPNAKGNRDILA